MRSACVLDLVLRLLLLWTSMEAYDVLTGWTTELLKLVGRARACGRSEEGERSTTKMSASSRKECGTQGLALITYWCVCLDEQLLASMCRCDPI